MSVTLPPHSIILTRKTFHCGFSCVKNAENETHVHFYVLKTIGVLQGFLMVCCLWYQLSMDLFHLMIMVLYSHEKQCEIAQTIT